MLGPVREQSVSTGVSSESWGCSRWSTAWPNDSLAGSGAPQARRRGRERKPATQRWTFWRSRPCTRRSITRTNLPSTKLGGRRSREAEAVAHAALRRSLAPTFWCLRPSPLPSGENSLVSAQPLGDHVRVVDLALVREHVGVRVGEHLRGAIADELGDLRPGSCPARAGARCAGASSRGATSLAMCDRCGDTPPNPGFPAAAEWLT